MMCYQIVLCQLVIGDWCLTIQDSMVVLSSVNICVVKMGPPCCIGTSGINHLVLYCSDSAVSKMKNRAQLHCCKSLKNHTAAVSYSTTCVGYSYIRSCIQKSQDNAHNTQVTCSSRVSR